jgi:hypothetical protein
MTVDIGDKSKTGDVGGLTTYPIYTNSRLVFSWYRMESGKFEINAYIS